MLLLAIWLILFGFIGAFGVNLGALSILALDRHTDHLHWRDSRRRDYDRPALMPWTLIQVLALLAAVMLTAAALAR